MSENQETAGTFWYWWYKDALPTGSKLPSFKLDGRKGWFYRSTIDSSSPQMQTSCLIFFPKPDHQVDSFASQLSPMFKTQVDEFHVMLIGFYSWSWEKIRIGYI